jgi:hypothetical protein
VLRACELRDIDPVVLCSSAAWDTGRIIKPPRGVLIRVDDYINPEDCLAALHREGLADREFLGVQTGLEFSVVTAAVLGRVLGCRSIDPATALHFRDKSLQKARLLAAGVPVTRWAVIPDIYDVRDVPLEYDRAVLKPIAGAGTEFTSMVRERKDLEEVSRACREQHESKRTFLLEEYVAGDEWMVEGVVFGGELLFFGLGIYAEPCIDAIADQAPISMRRLDPIHEADAYKIAEPVVRDAIAALGLLDSVFHMELFREHGTGRIIFSECAVRQGGALICEQVFAKFNVDLADAALMCAIGRRPEIEVKVNPKVVGCVGLNGPVGTIISYPPYDELLSQPNVEFARIRIPPGTSLAKFSTTPDMFGNVVITAESIEEFDERVPELQKWFLERVVVAEPALTVGERWAWSRRHWPEQDHRDPFYIRERTGPDWRADVGGSR